MVMLFAVGLVACGKSLKSFKVNFIVDNEVVKTMEATNKEEILLPEEPKKEGYTFDGWYKESQRINKWDFATDTTGKEIVLEPFENYDVYEGIYLYAKWIEN